MIKYKNITDEVLHFRAHNAKGIVQRYALQPDKIMESDREVTLKGLEKIPEKIITRKPKKESDK